MVLSRTRFHHALFAALLFVAAQSVAQAPLVADSAQINWADLYRYFDQPVDPGIFLVRPGEQFSVTFLDAKLSDLKLAVDPEGRVVHPALGVLDVGGKTLSAARDILQQALASLYQVEQIDIAVGPPRRIAVTVTGAVAEPGVYKAFTSQRVSEVIKQAGGVGRHGSTRFIQLVGGPRALDVDLDRARHLGDSEADPPLYAGYTVFVPDRVQERVQVVGEVNQPRDLELRPEDSLSSLLALAGGMRSRANSDSIMIIGRDRRGLASDMDLQPGDIILVPAAQEDGVSELVTVFGAVERPGRFDFSTGGTVQDLIDRSGGMMSDASPSLVTLFRRARADAWGRVSDWRYPITSSMGAGGSVLELAVQPGDSVYIPFYIGFVRVTGEVLNPGLFPFVPGQDVLFYVKAAGGFLPTAETREAEMFNRIARVTSTVAVQTRVQEGFELIVTRREELK